MQFSDTSGLTGLVEDIDFLADTNSTSYPLKDKARNANRWLYRAVSWVLQASPKWEFDDRNLTTLPIITTTLVAGQQDYELPSDLLRVERASVKDQDGNYQDLQFITLDQIREDPAEFEETNAMPRYALIRGSSILLYPAPAAANVTTAQGLKLYVSRELDAFASTDNTQEAGISEPFHRIISLGAAYDHVMKYDTQKATMLLGEIEREKKDLMNFYGDRNKQVKAGITSSNRTQDYV